MKLCWCYGLWRHLHTVLLNANLAHHVRTAAGSVAGCVTLIRYNPPPRWCEMSRSAPVLSSSKTATTSLRVGRFCIRKSIPGNLWIANWTLCTSRFLINSPPRRNISTKEFTRLTTRWTVATISLSKPSKIQHRIFTGASISLSKTYNRAKLHALDSICSNVPT